MYIVEVKSEENMAGFCLGSNLGMWTLLLLRLLAVYTSDIEADVLDELDGPLERCRL
jgi:hypothetical protein